MTKNEFLALLKARLTGLPDDDIKRSVEYYSEMIDDLTEDGICEAEAVSSLGSIDGIVKEIIGDISLTKIVKQKVKPKRKLHALEILLLILGMPLWFSLLVAFLAMLFSFYVAIWSVVIAFFATSLALFVTGLVLIAASFIPILSTVNIPFMLTFGMGFLCIGMAILLFLLSELMTKATIKILNLAVIGVKRMFIGKEEEQ